jgi:hypothetical protein
MAQPSNSDRFLKPAKLLDAANVSGNVASTRMYVGQWNTVGLQVTSNGGTHVGIMWPQLSNDGDNWMNAGSNVTLANGAAASSFQTIQHTGALYMRVNYTVTSGTGTLTAIATRKKP